MKRRRCCGPWYARRPPHFREDCMAAHELRGSDGGVVFWRVPSAKAVASSLLGVRGSPGAGDQVLSTNEALVDTRRVRSFEFRL